MGKKLENKDTEVVEVKTEEVAEKKVTKKRTTKKAEESTEKVAEKKPAAKRSTKKAVKTTFVVQASGKEFSTDELIAKVKEAWFAEGNKEADLKEIAVYVKPEEAAVYYVINNVATGKVDF